MTKTIQTTLQQIMQTTNDKKAYNTIIQDLKWEFALHLSAAFLKSGVLMPLSPDHSSSCGPQ